jgi:TRAP-type mannitol/chloroaromatic compound transport system permease small subunit
VEKIGSITAYAVWIGAFILFIEVILRYVFGAPTVWAHGYTQRIYGSYFILIFSFSLLKGGHVRIDMLINKFGRFGKMMFDLLNLTCLLLWTAVLIPESWKFFLKSWKFKEVDQMVLAHPVYPVKFILFIGTILIALQGLSLFVQIITNYMKGEK